MSHYEELRLDGHWLILCHYPFRTLNGIGKKSINRHGHSHGMPKPITRQFDVGVDPPEAAAGHARRDPRRPRRASRAVSAEA